MESLLFHDKMKLEVLAAVSMPDHAHLICFINRDAAREEYLLSDIMASIKSYSAHAINKKLNRKGHVWLDESFDHVIRHEEGIDAKIDYVKINPVRAGLVKAPGEYPWMYAETWWIGMSAWIKMVSHGQHCRLGERCMRSENFKVKFGSTQ